MKESTLQRTRGFALVLVLALLGLVLLVALALATLSRSAQSSAQVAIQRTQAQRNALLALGVALCELQRRAGRDDVITGMAGISGVASGAGNPARQWAGVWNSERQHVTWLVSGTSGAAIPNLGNGVTIVSTASLGADATDREHVRVLRETIAPTSGAIDGGYAYWIGDEGVKLSCALPENASIVPGAKHAINQQFPSVSPGSAELQKLVAFEQMTLAGATTVQRQGAFHSYGRTHFSVDGLSLAAGRLNVNTTSVRYWTGVGATFIRFNPSGAASMTAAQFGADAAGLVGRPFRSVDDFLTALAPRLTARGASVAAFNSTMRPWLALRSETFRIRGYGDAGGAFAYCEAIVQRLPEIIDDGSGRRFAISSFRWLGPDDI